MVAPLLAGPPTTDGAQSERKRKYAADKCDSISDRPRRKTSLTTTGQRLPLLALTALAKYFSISQLFFTLPPRRMVHTVRVPRPPQTS